MKPQTNKVSLKSVERFFEKSEIDKAIEYGKEICLSVAVPNDEKMKCLQVLLVKVSDEAVDIINRWRDSLPFYKGEEKEALVNLLVMVATSEMVSSYERLYTTITLYNHGYIELCYSCFIDIVCDKTALIDHRVEACRYLFASEESDYKQVSQDCLLDIIESIEYPCNYRYRLIAGYISKTGIASVMNSVKLKVPYDEEFVYGLQTVFFGNEKNDLTERILSGQHILGMVCASQEEKKLVADVLLRISRDDRHDEKIRSDAADVVVRLADNEQARQAREVIARLGSKDNEERDKTIYNDKQNVHNEQINSCVNKFIEKMIATVEVKPRPFKDVHREVSDLVRRKKLKPDKRFLVFKSLNRISIDTATFTEFNSSLAEIFVYVWIKIQTYEDEKKKALEDRLVEELIDMAGWCSTGHASRLINVFSVYETTFTINWKDQIKANVSGRMNARIRDLKDSKLKGSIAMGMLKEADEKDRKVYVEYVTSSLEKIQEEMKKEFVTETGYISPEKFDEYFREGSSSWLD